MTLIKPALVAAALAAASPAFAGGFGFPFMPNMTFPQEKVTVTKSGSTTLETCERSKAADICDTAVDQASK